jgi:hypothetical protein
MIGVYVVNHERLSNETRFNHDSLTMHFRKSRNCSDPTMDSIIRQQNLQISGPAPNSSQFFLDIMANRVKPRAGDEANVAL